MAYFDLHVHPSLKGSLTNDPVSYNAWRSIFLQRTFYGLLKKFKQIIDSQASLRQLEEQNVLAIVALVALEKAFARNFAIRIVLANPRTTPLYRPLLDEISSGAKSYFDMLKRDLHHLEAANSFQKFNILKDIGGMAKGMVNVILSVEGAHSFQSVKDEEGEAAIAQSILYNFRAFKNNSVYRLHHLTLTHLTRQPACVHCFGVKIKLLFINATPDLAFQPDPAKMGISPLGIQLIEIAYANTESPRVLIDIKHMSLFSRQQLYALRKQKNWDQIPLLVSHAGVTGQSFEASAIQKINQAAGKDGCDEVLWYKAKNKNNNIYFNPWTINLFDEDIVEVGLSGGLIGVSLDERILGSGKIFGEYMSPVEIAQLGLEEKTALVPPTGFGLTYSESTEPVFEAFMKDPEVIDILTQDKLAHPDENWTNYDPEKIHGDLIFDLDEPPADELSEEELVQNHRFSHIMHLTNNILHIAQVGYTYHLDGLNGRKNILDCICLGSDLDGLIDAINFPKHPGEDSVNEKDWVTTDKYDQLEKALTQTVHKLLPDFEGLSDFIADIPSFVQKIVSTNGLSFLKRNFV